MILCSQIFTLQKSWWEAVQGIKPNPVFEAMRMLPEHGQAAFICGGGEQLFRWQSRGKVD
jgi:hypothetical protein